MVSDQTIEDAASLLRVNEILINGAWMFERGLHGPLGDFVEGHALNARWRFGFALLCLFRRLLLFGAILIKFDGQDIHEMRDLPRVVHALRSLRAQLRLPLSFGSIYATSPDCVADIFDHHAGWVDKLAGETLPPYQGGDHMVLTLREPVGVVGAVIPWNAAWYGDPSATR